MERFIRTGWHKVMHFLYEPAMLGRGCVAVSGWRGPLHRIHLIPGAVLERSCKKSDQRVYNSKCGAVQ